MLAWQQQMAIACTMTANHRWFIKCSTFRGQTYDQEAAVQRPFAMREAALSLSSHITALASSPGPFKIFRMGLGTRLITAPNTDPNPHSPEESHDPRKRKLSITSLT